MNQEHAIKPAGEPPYGKMSLDRGPDEGPVGDGPVEYGVVPIRNDSPIDRMTKEQKDKVSRFYELLANALPLEGRDYRIDFTPMPDGKVSAKVVGLNKIGRAFSDHVAEFWTRFGPGK